MSETKITVSSSVSKEEKTAETNEESTPQERIPTPDIISSAPAPEAATVTTVKDEVRKVSSSQLSPKMSGQTTRTSKTSVKRSSEYESTIGQLTRDYRGTSPAVLEGIASHPVLYSKAFESTVGRPRLSARSKKIIRDTTDLALVAPGLKSLLEVGYYVNCVASALKVALCCVGLKLVWH